MKQYEYTSSMSLEGRTRKILLKKGDRFWIEKQTVSDKGMLWMDIIYKNIFGQESRDRFDSDILTNTSKYLPGKGRII